MLRKEIAILIYKHLEGSLSEAEAGQPAPLQKPYLKSHEVRKLLKISHGTLQHLRDSGQLKYSKVGGIMFYALKDITRLIEGENEIQK